MSWVVPVGTVDAADVVVDDTIGRTGSTDLQGYLDYGRTRIGPVKLAWEASDLPAPSAGVRTITETTLVLAVVSDPANTFSVEAPIVGLGTLTSGLDGNSAGPGPAFDVPASVPNIEVSRVRLGNISTDPAAVVLRSESGLTRIHEILVTPGSVGIELHNVGLGDLTNVFVATDEQGIKVTGTTGSMGIQAKTLLFGGGLTPATYDGVHITGTIGEVLIEVDSAGVGGPDVGGGYGVNIDPAVVAPPSSIIVRNSTGTPGQLMRPAGLLGTDPRVFVTSVKPDRNTAPIGGIEYNDTTDELLVTFSGIVPVTSSIPSESQALAPVLPRATMDSWEIDTTDPAEVIWRYTGAETILGRFSWSAALEKNGGGSDTVTVRIERITGGVVPVPDSELTVPVSSPSVSFQRAGGTIQVAQNDEFRMTLTNQSTTVGVLVGVLDIEVLRV